MQITLLAYSGARTHFGFSSREILLESQTQTIEQVLNALSASWRSSVPGLRVACDSEFVPFSRELKGGETIALIPPVSGG